MKYSGDDIKILTDVAAVRTNPGVYIGDTDSFGLWICLKEIIDNARDEAMLAKGSKSFIHVSRYTESEFSVYDAGRGIPVDIQKQTGRPAIESVFCKLHAGAKMGQATAYKETLGVHGVGACVTNAFSIWLSATTKRSRSWHCIEMAEGKPGKLATGKKPSGLAFDCGTLVWFELDVAAFEPGSVITDERITTYLGMMAKLYPGITIKYTDQSGAHTTYHHKDSLDKQLTSEHNLQKRRVFVSDAPGVKLTLAITDVPSSEGFSSFVCGSPTPDGGTHIDALHSIMQVAVSKIYSKPVDMATFCSSLHGVLNMELVAPKFRGQTKTKLYSTKAKPMVMALADKLATFIEANKAALKPHLAMANEVHIVNTKYETDKALAKSTTTKGGRESLPIKMAVADCDPSKRELFIVEGESAGGTAKNARHKQYQEVLPLRGKFINVSRKGSSVVNNQVVKDLLMAMGLNPSNPDQPWRIQKGGKIVLLMDSDADGCFAPHTVINTRHLGYVQFRKLYRLQAANRWKPFEVEGVDEHGRRKWVQVTGRVSCVTTQAFYEVVFENDRAFKVTADHYWPLADQNDPRLEPRGTLKMLQTRYLVKGDKLMYAPDADGCDAITVQRVVRHAAPNAVSHCISTEGQNFIVGRKGCEVVSGNSHIRILVLGFLWRFAKKAFEDGIVHYVDVPPYSYSPPDKDPIYDVSVSAVKSRVSKFNRAYLHRMKGWGEVSAARLRTLAFDKSPHLVRVNPLSAHDAAKFEAVMASSDASSRAMYLFPQKASKTRLDRLRYAKSVSRPLKPKKPSNPATIKALARMLANMKRKHLTATS